MRELASGGKALCVVVGIFRPGLAGSLFCSI